MFKVELLDEAGSEIGAAFFKEAVQKFFDMVVPGGVFYMGGGKVKVADPKYSQGRPYEITFDEKSTITPAAEDASISKVQYNFTPLAQVAQLEKDKVVDVLGVLNEVRDVQNIHTKAGKDMVKREVLLTDQSGIGGASCIELTLWGDKAEKTDLAVGQVLAVKGAKVSEWNTRSLGLQQSSSVQLDPELPEAHQLRGWWEGGGRAAQPTMLSERGRGSGGGQGQQLAADTDLTLRHAVSSLKGGEGAPDAALDGSSLLVVKACVKHIRTDPEKLSYPACRNQRDSRQCNKKLDNSSGSWTCQACGPQDAPEYRYMLNVCVQDAAGDNFVSLFDKEAAEMLGMKAEQMLALSGWNPAEGGAAGEPDPRYMKVFQSLLFSQYIFTVRLKVDTYREEQKMSATVVRCKPLKGALLATECGALIANINKYLKAA